MWRIISNTSRRTIRKTPITGSTNFDIPRWRSETFTQRLRTASQHHVFKATGIVRRRSENIVRPEHRFGNVSDLSRRRCGRWTAGEPMFVRGERESRAHDVLEEVADDVRQHGVWTLSVRTRRRLEVNVDVEGDQSTSEYSFGIVVI